MCTWDGLNTKNIEIQLAKLIYLYNASVQINYHILTELRPTCILERSVWTRNNLENFEYPLFFWSQNKETAFKCSYASTGFYNVW